MLLFCFLMTSKYSNKSEINRVGSYSVSLIKVGSIESNMMGS